MENCVWPESNAKYASGAVVTAKGEFFPALYSFRHV